MLNICNNAAYVVSKINEFWQEKPGKKILQKIVYLIEQKGVKLGFEYELHFYGPYSSLLDEQIIFLSAEGIIEVEHSGLSHLLSVHDSFQAIPEDISSNQMQKIEEVINHFKGKTPYELELLTTAIYAYNHLQGKSRNDVINGVKRIKGDKYSTDKINTTLEEFDFFGIKIA